MRQLASSFTTTAIRIPRVVHQLRLQMAIERAVRQGDWSASPVCWRSWR